MANGLTNYFIMKNPLEKLRQTLSKRFKDKATYLYVCTGFEENKTMATAFINGISEKQVLSCIHAQLKAMSGRTKAPLMALLEDIKRAELANAKSLPNEK